jgi:Spy/CpxP family protein refolding chaperone
MIKHVFTRIIFKIAVALIGCMVVALPVSAFEGGPRHHGEKGEEFGFGFLKQLDLTDAQKSGITEIMAQYHPQLDALRGDIHQARQQMRTSMSGQPFDEAQIRAAYQGMSPLLENMFVLRAKMKNEIWALLTADQLKALEEKRESWHQKKQDRRDHGQAMMK